MKDFGENIAVMLLGPLGDVINSSIVFRLLKEAYPESRLSLITTDRGTPAAAGIPEIDEIYTLDRSKKNYRKNIDAFKFAWSLRGKFDTVIVLDNHLRSAICAFLTMAKHRVGRGCQLREIFLTDVVPFLEEEKKGRIHISEHYARCLKPLNIYKENADTYFEYTENDKNFVDKLLSSNNLSDKNLIGFCPACRLNRKTLKINDCVKIIDKINSLDKYKVIVIGGNDIKNYVSHLNDNSNVQFVDFSGKTTFTQTAALIDKCKKIISVDTSCMHLALARKIPTMAIFFNNLTTKWGPKNLKTNKTYTNVVNKKIDIEKLWNNFLELPDKIES